MYAAIYKKDFENKLRRTYLTFLTWVSAIKSVVMLRIAYLWTKNNGCLGHNKGSLLHFSRTTRTEVNEALILHNDCPEDVMLCGTRSKEVLHRRTRGDRTREISHTQKNNPAIATVFTIKWTFCTQISCNAWEESLYRGADKYFPIYFVWWWEFSFDASTNIPPIMIINRIYIHQDLLSL